MFCSEMSHKEQVDWLANTKIDLSALMTQIITYLLKCFISVYIMQIFIISI